MLRWPRGENRRWDAWVPIAIGLAAWSLATTELTAESVWTHEEVSLPARADIGKPSIVTALAVHPSGDLVAIAGDDHFVRIWDIDQRQFAATLTGHQDWVRSLRYSPDGSLLASAGNDGRLLIWNVAAREIYRQHQQPQAITHVVFDPLGSQLATVGFRSPLKYYDVSTGTEVQSVACPCEDMRALAISPDSTFIAGGGRNGKIRIWRADSAEVAREFVGHQRRIHAIEFSPDGQAVASCGDDRVIRVSRVDGSDAYMLKGPNTKLMSLAFCGDNQIAVGGSDNLIRVWDLQTRSVDTQLAGHTGSVVALSYAGGTLVSAGFDTKVRIWTRPRNVAGERVTTPGRVGRRVQEFKPR